MTASASTRTVPSNLIQITEPTKNALKKAAKKAEKEKKKADVAAKLQEELALRQREETANDFAAENYGSPSSVYTSGLGWIRFNQIAAREDQLSLFRCVVDNARSQSAKLAFLNASQELHSVQMVVAEDREAGVSRPMVKFAAGIPPESVCTVFGVVKRTTEPVKSATVQDFEVHVNKVFVVSRPHMPLPLQPSDSNTPLPANEKVDDSDSHGALVSLNTRLNHRVLDLRATVNHCIFLLKDGVDCLFQDFLRGQGFVRIHTPKIIGAASEGGSNVFRVDYFQKDCYLAQSPQLYKQMAVGARFPKVFEVGGIYRAENSNTARHLCEFTGLDMEMEILDDYHEVFDMLERLMLFIFNGLNERYAKEIELVRNVYPLEPFKLPPADQVPRINFAEGVEMLRAAGEALDDFDDLTTPQEKKLGQLVLEKYGSDFYTLDQFPLGIRPFCTMPSVHSKLSNSYDMFMRGQEILSGAQRVHTFELLVQRIKEMNMDPEADGLRDYVNAFKYGISPHGGGGLGLERVVQFFLGLPNIRLASLFPRDPGRVLP